MNTFRSYFRQANAIKLESLTTQIDSIILNINDKIDYYSDPKNQYSEKVIEKVKFLLSPYLEYFNDLKNTIATEGGNILKNQVVLNKYEKQVIEINALLTNIHLVIDNVPLSKEQLGMQYTEHNVTVMSSNSGGEEEDYAEARAVVSARKPQPQVGGSASKNKSRFTRRANKKRISKKSSKRGNKRRSHRKH
jgi:hypothetical protein